MNKTTRLPLLAGCQRLPAAVPAGRADRPRSWRWEKGRLGGWRIELYQWKERVLMTMGWIGE